jgi:hypothetical protein
MFKVFIVNGGAASGKDTFVKFAIEALAVHSVPGYCYSTIDPVNSALQLHFSWDGTTKDEVYRRFASRVKEAWVEYNDGPNNAVYDRVVTAYRGLGEALSIFFIMCREPLEIDKLTHMFSGNARSVFIENTRVTPVMSNNSDAVATEAYAYDFRVTNESTLDALKQDAYEFINHVLIEDIYKEDAMAVIDMSTGKFVNEAPIAVSEIDPLIEDAALRGFAEGDLIIDITAALKDSSRYPVNDDMKVMRHHIAEGRSVADPHETERVSMAQLATGMHFSVPQDKAPNRIYIAQSNPMLYRRHGEAAFNYMIVTEPVYDPDVVLRPDLVLGDIKFVHMYHGVMLCSVDETKKFKLLFGFDDFAKFAAWANSIPR